MAEWVFVYSEVHSLLMNEAFFSGFTDFAPIPGMLRTIHYINRAGLQTCYTSGEELQRVREEGRVFFSRKYRAGFRLRIKRCARAFERFYHEFERASLKKLTNRQLLNLLESYLDHLRLMFAYYQVAGGRSYPVLEERVREGLAKYYKGEALESTYNRLLLADSIDILQREELELRQLAVKRHVPDSLLVAHSKKFALLHFSTYDQRKVVDILRMRMTGSKISKEGPSTFLKRIRREKMLLRQEQRRLLAPVREQEIIGLVRFLREQAHLRFEYKNWKNGGEYKFLSLFEEIARRISLSTEEFLFSHTLADTQAALLRQNKLVSAERLARRRIFIFVLQDGRKRFLSGTKAEEFEAKLLNTDVGESELRGICASPGIARGRARVIIYKGLKDYETEAAKFRQGEILVTTMTQPSMVSLMKRAAAVVTDQGGMTSHAATLCREFGIPCIVGTLKATRVFKNGDVLDVDAQNGTVRKK